MDWRYEDGRVYCVDEDGALIAEASFFPKANGEVDIAHTYVAPQFRGQGLASNMMKAAAEYLRQRGLKATASCSYAYAWLKRNEQSYADIISDELLKQFRANKAEE